MYAVASRFEDASLPPTVSAPVLERAEGAVRIGFEAVGGQSRLRRAYQRGSLKVRFPRLHDATTPEGVVINTAGGITGGDRFSIEASLGAGASLTLTTPAAERIYRSSGGEGRVDVAVKLDEGARLAWLPQETILFDGGRLARTFEADIAADSRLVVCESVILGRAAHGETVRQGLIRDRWRLRRCGRLVYADDLRLDAEQRASVAGAGTLGGARAFASLLIAAPDAGACLEAIREALDRCPAAGGASAWNGLVAVRMVAVDGAALRRTVAEVCAAGGIRLPRAWSI